MIRALFLLFICVGVASGQILHWDGTTISGTERVTVGPAVVLDGFDLVGARLRSVNLDGASFVGTNLTTADLAESRLSEANFSNAIVNGTNLTDTTKRGFTKDQLYSTLSYKNSDLSGIWLRSNDLTGWDFSGQDLSDALLGYSTLVDADFSDAIIIGLDLAEVTRIGGFVAEQFYATASYQTGELAGLRLPFNDLDGWDMSNLDLSDSKVGFFVEGTSFMNSDLKNSQIEGYSFAATDFRGADLRGARFKTRSMDAELSLAVFDEKTIYDRHTVFLPDFDPAEFGMTLVPEPSDFGIGFVFAGLLLSRRRVR